MNTKMMHTLFVFGILSVLLFVSACSAQTPTPDVAKVNTMIAQTVAVQQTRTEIARPTNTPQPTPTNTQQPPTPTIEPTSVQSTATTPTVQPVGGIDGGEWVASNPVDKAAQFQGQTFKVNVKLMNTGTSTWTTDYGIRYISGDITASEDTYYMPIAVPPGAQVNMDVKLTAPTKTGLLRGNWVIFNSANVAFSNFYFEYDIK
ncbi:MAG: NBR1-Ig-like domain-containing protein [Anaerolineaceae bacterium]